MKDLKAAILASSHFDFLIDVIDLFDEQQRQMHINDERAKYKNVCLEEDSDQLIASFGSQLADTLMAHVGA